MNVKHIESIVRMKVCPACAKGVTRELGKKIYQCDHSRCGETFDLSHLTAAMIRGLLDKKKGASPATGRGGKPSA